RTGCILLVHQSNFKIEGFTFKPEIKDIVKMANKNNVPVFYDLGSGCLIDTTDYSLKYEPTVQDAISDGVDLVFFSGDKLIGGPQAGIIAGKDKYIKIIENHPLTRALRLDKILLSGLIATLQLYLSDKYKEIPLWNILNKKTEDIYKLVVKWKKNLKNDSILQVTKSSTMIGGGSIPEQSVDSYSLEINFEKSSIKADTLNKKLKSRKTPILSRIKDNKLYIDPITILHGQENEVFKALKEEMKSLNIID
ncbi:MAG: L-seryl-tRNA(Sec) selenium transferase, partial [Chloroflexi bacterium]|nr:L-seryl-tRNA(Sec) selenium transferase [Chloroflexota bacterium]